MKYMLCPSILSADFARLGDQMEPIKEMGAGYLHFDVMDGMFVPSISFGLTVLKSLKQSIDMIYDVHLMIVEPARYVERFAAAGAELITVHYEACRETDVRTTLEMIRKSGAKAGVALCPKTPVSVLEGMLDLIDMVLIMTVHPGFGGQSLMPETLPKITQMRSMFREAGMADKDIQVDGGVYVHNVEKVLDAGANVIVSGSGVFKGDPVQNTKEFMEILKRYE